MAEINISIDDICPHPVCKNEEVLNRVQKIKNKFPSLKVTLFIPTAYTRYNEDTYYISSSRPFLDLINGLDLSIYELGWHGHYHGILSESSNNEFRLGSYERFISIMDEMRKEAERAGISSKMSPVFRPPAFWMHPAAFRAAKTFGIKVLALSSLPHHLLAYGGVDSSWGKVSHFTSLPDYKPLIYKEKMDIVYHAYETDQNYLDDRKTDDLISFLSNIGRLDFKKFTE